MAYLGESFVAADLPEGREYSLLPDGWYDATIVRAEVNDTKAGTGQKIDIRYDITGPTHQGRVVFGSLNIRNPSAKAEEIGRQQLGEVMRAIGLPRVDDTDQLVGASLSIKIKTKPAEGQWEARNEVSGWRAPGGEGAAPMPKLAAVADGKKAPPWAAKK